MRKSFEYRIYPTRSQRRTLGAILEECRWVYNETLAYRKQAWEERQESISLYDTHYLLPRWKKDRPSLRTVYAQVLQDVQMRVDLAYKAFFRRVKAGDKPGYPRFKGTGRYDSITYPQSGFALRDGKLRLSKVGNVRIKLHRFPAGRTKTLSIRRSATGKWYAHFSCEVEPQPMLLCEKTVGIDVGLASFATLSTSGEKIDNPRFFRKEQKALAKAQRKSNRKVVARVHERIANRRKDFAHQLSCRLVNEYGVIAFEKLNIQGMSHNHRLAKSIGDAAWGQLIRYTTYKAEWAGRRVVLVDPRNTSKMCSQCGCLVDKSLSQRVHSCPHCGLILDRDHNAAINILRLGLQSLGTKPLEAAVV